MCCVWGGQVSNERRDNSVYLSATHWPPWPQETGWDEGFRAFVFTSAPGLANKILMVNIAWRQEIGKIGRAGAGLVGGRDHGDNEQDFVLFWWSE